MSPCAFCGREGDMARNAHILPDWIRAIAPVTGPAPRVVDVGDEQHTAPSRRLFSERVRAICQKECNGGWMSALEGDAKPILTPLIRGEAAFLSPPEQMVIGRWAGLVAAMACFLRPPQPPHREYLRRFYETKSPPPATVIWIGHHDMTTRSESYARQGLTFDFRQASAPVTELPPRPVTPEDANGHTVTFSACHFACKVVACFPNFDAPRVRMNFELDPGEGVVPIWPHPKGVLIWPPGPILDNSALTALGGARIDLSVQRVY